MKKRKINKTGYKVSTIQTAKRRCKILKPIPGGSWNLLPSLTQKGLKIEYGIGCCQWYSIKIKYMPPPALSS